jgi:hypothetical protein
VELIQGPAAEYWRPGPYHAPNFEASAARAMTAESDAFEQLNERIARLVHGRGATVQWNGSIPDPDNPAELRQIDVLICCDDGRLVTVECRHRTGVQNVMWIEELAGRKLSIGLDGMIAVSVAGFSSLARIKAQRFGIALYDFETLTDAEIAMGWPSYGGSNLCSIRQS